RRLFDAAGGLPGRTQGRGPAHPTVPARLPPLRPEGGPMDIDSTRFGTFTVPDDLVLTFPDGLPGLPGDRYVLVAQDEGAPFSWLHSVEHADVALPVTNPWLFFADYDVRVSDEEATELGLESPEQAEIYCVVRATPELGDCT